LRFVWNQYFSEFWIAKDFILNGLRSKDIIRKGLAASQQIPYGNDSQKSKCNSRFPAGMTARKASATADADAEPFAFGVRMTAKKKQQRRQERLPAEDAEVSLRVRRRRGGFLLVCF
jgi:hypothetical protein